MKKILLLMLSLVMVTTMMAEGVTPDEALNQARNFVKNRENKGMRPHRAPGTAASRLVMAKQVNGLYVFNVAKDEGFVIVSNDDRTEPILGYSDSGHFDPENMPENMRAWLQGYADQIAWLNEHPEVQNTIQKAPTKNPVAPLMQSEWNQNAPYWNDCPIFQPTGAQSVTGCVATAMAQIMYYHKYPEKTTKTIPSYTYGSRWGMNFTENAVPVTTFDWTNMIDNYTNYTDAQGAAVAALMHCCGTSVNMDYADADNDGSGANTGKVAGAMKEYFDYSATTRYVGRGSYSMDDWNNLIYSELAEGRPVLYGGQSSGGGHAFVVDGYDGDELFHVNWGWGGHQDGYFLLSVLNPGSTAGIGASTSSDGYSFGQDAVIGIQPNHGEEGEEEVGAHLTFNDPSISGQSITFGKISNDGGDTHYFNFGIGIIDENGNITAKITKSGYCDPGSYFSPKNGASVFTVNSSWGNGTYKVIPISRVGGTSEWIPGMNPNLQYFEVVINGSNITITFVGGPELSVTSFNFPGNKKAGVEQVVEATIQNNGAEFYGPLHLFASMTNDKGKAASTSGMTIRSGRSITTEFTFKPNTAGTYNIWICTDEGGNNVIGQSSVVIEAASTETYSLSAQGLAIENGNPSSTYGGNIYGTRIKGAFSLKNTGTIPFNDNITIQLYEYKTYDGVLSFWSSDKQTIPVVIAAGETAAITFDFINQNKTNYLIRCTYGNTYTRYPQYNSYTLADGIEMFMADGTSNATGAQSSVTVPENAVAVNLTGVSGVTNVTGGNENTLFIFGADDNVPSSLNGRNVVKGGNAENITLQDGCDFYSPVTFTADNISYTRTFDTGLTRDYKNWTTIVLPFNVSEVTVDLTSQGTAYAAYSAYPIDWFHNAEETKKNFWVMEFGSEDNGIVNFSHAAEIKAARPLLIAVPGAEWGSKNDLTNLPITFHGQNATVSGDFRASTSGDNYKMKGVVAQKVFNDIFVLNADGTAFTRQNSATVDAFRAYFEPTSTAATASMLMMEFGDGNQGETTALKPVFDHGTMNQSNAIYDLQGRKLNGEPTQKGIYIVNGKKVIKK
jgi:hypothetical protein